MVPFISPSLNPSQPAIIWNRKYLRKRGDELYKAENSRLSSALLTKAGLYLMIEKLLDARRRFLDPPDEYRYAALSDFLRKADIRSLTPHGSSARKTILLDERKDPSGGRGSTREWDDDSPNGYMNRPPTGDPQSIFFKCLSNHEFITRVNENNRQDIRADKRVIYISDINSSTAMALVATVAVRSAAMLREFLYRHILCRNYFGIKLEHIFELEMHIPFYALRKGRKKVDLRNAQGRPIRTVRELPLSVESDEAKKEYYYEVVASLVVTGVDEWAWTAYFCVDTYFGEEDWQEYPCSSNFGSDGPSGGCIWQKYPHWNPREYFLIVLHRRMLQATSEWTALITTFTEKLHNFEERMLFQFFDDENLRKTEELTLTVATIRNLRDALIRTINAWKDFERRGLRFLETDGKDSFQERWQSYIDAIQGHISELQSMHVTMSQKLELFNSMRDGLVNASALRESTAATKQGDDIGLLTKMTVFYLPLSLATSVCGISFLPNSSWMWVLYILVVIITVSATVHAARHGELLNHLFQKR